MPSIKRTLTAADPNALSNLRFSNPKRPAAISLWASSVTAGEDLTFGVDEMVIGEALEINLEIANQVVDTGRDQLLFREPVPPGQYILDIPVVATDMTYLMVQEVV